VQLNQETVNQLKLEVMGLKASLQEAQTKHEMEVKLARDEGERSVVDLTERLRKVSCELEIETSRLGKERDLCIVERDELRRELNKLKLDVPVISNKEATETAS
jgi:hypothetical protein